MVRLGEGYRLRYTCSGAGAPQLHTLWYVFELGVVLLNTSTLDQDPGLAHVKDAERAINASHAGKINERKGVHTLMIATLWLFSQDMSKKGLYRTSGQ